MSLLTVILVLSISTFDQAATAKRVFVQAEARLNAAKSVSGETVDAGGQTREKFLMQKPGSIRSINGNIEIYCNGKTQWHHLVDSKEYFSRDVSKTGGFGAPYALDGFFGKTTGSSAPYFVKRTTFDMRRVDGKLYAAKTTYFESFERNDHMAYLVDAKSKLPIGWNQDFGFGPRSFRFKNLRLNVKIPPGAFEWKPLPGLKEMATDGRHSM